MRDWKENKLLWAVVFLTVFNIGAYIMCDVVVNRTLDKVLDKLEKPYGPSPYGPGFDPDKVDVTREVQRGLNVINSEWREQLEKDRGW